MSTGILEQRTTLWREQILSVVLTAIIGIVIESLDVINIQEGLLAFILPVPIFVIIASWYSRVPNGVKTLEVSGLPCGYKGDVHVYNAEEIAPGLKPKPEIPRIKQMAEDPWETIVPEKYKVGDVVRGKVTMLIDFGAIVELEPGVEGLLHISELAEIGKYVLHPKDIISEGQKLDVKIIVLDVGRRKLGLSLKQVHKRGDISFATKKGKTKP